MVRGRAPPPASPDIFNRPPQDWQLGEAMSAMTEGAEAAGLSLGSWSASDCLRACVWIRQHAPLSMMPQLGRGMLDSGFVYSEKLWSHPPTTTPRCTVTLLSYQAPTSPLALKVRCGGARV
ncbi:unnamed protein product [Pleuronectes platessa]|uniref:Uncharacterized protein n=1 Tax=Pleuronectes platessa TaxID=8262 RepID=A0A9N7UZL1_PLEPL|nr:unnamed protein product [Pleuronectes platessa]